MSQNCLKFWDKFETKLRTDLRPYKTILRLIWQFSCWEQIETFLRPGFIGGAVRYVDGSMRQTFPEFLMNVVDVTICDYKCHKGWCPGGGGVGVTHHKFL